MAWCHVETGSAEAVEQVRRVLEDLPADQRPVLCEGAQFGFQTVAQRDRAAEILRVVSTATISNGKKADKK